MVYAIEAELVPWLGMLPQINLAHVEEARRRSAELVGQAPRYEPTVPVDIRDLRVPGPEGAPDVSIRVYTSRNGDGDPRPGLLYIQRRNEQSLLKRPGARATYNLRERAGLRSASEDLFEEAHDAASGAPPQH